MIEQEQQQEKERNSADRRSHRRLNERQWETVVTRLYGNPHQDKQLSVAQANKKAGAKQLQGWEVDQMVERLYPEGDDSSAGRQTKERKEQWLLQQRVEILGKELRAMRSKPQISRTSERMARGRLHIAERVDDVLNQRDKKLQELIKDVELAHGNPSHMPYISPRAREKVRGYEDLIQWQANRAERLKQKEEALQVEEISATYHPMIDEHSSLLATQRISQEGRPEDAAERLYSQRARPTQEMITRAEHIHADDFRHSHFSHH